MKYLNVIFIGLFLSFTTTSFGQADAIDTYFKKYKDDKNLTMVYVSPKMFQMFSKVTEEEVDQEIVQVIKGLKGLKILAAENNGQMYYDEAVKQINTNEYEELMTVRDDDQNVKFMVKDSNNGNIVHELLLLVGGGDDKFVLMSFIGDIDLKKIGKLAKKMDIDGLDHLDKLNKD